jgi:hypothetical protein
MTNPRKDYRLLVDGEVIQLGDQAWDMVLDEWYCLVASIGVSWSHILHNPVRRKIQQEEKAIT